MVDIISLSYGRGWCIRVQDNDGRVLFIFNCVKCIRIF